MTFIPISMDKRLHIVSFDVPAPPDYGGVIDVYFRAKALKQSGVYIVLHCFAYGRNRDVDLSEIADEVYFYDRSKSFLFHFSPLPFIVKSRMNEKLNRRLLQNQDPILLEGHHCAGILLDKRFRDRNLFVRIHNVEQHYYSGLAMQEKNPFKKLYFRLEAAKLKRFELNLKKATALFCLSIPDQQYFEKLALPAYLWDIGLNLETAFEEKEQIRQAIFHGNLSVAENQRAVLRLLQLWNKAKLDLPLLLCGKNPPAWLAKQVQGNSNIRLMANPRHEALMDLIQSSQFNLSLSEQATGTKIKLLQNLLYGNRCVSNRIITDNSGIANEAELFETDDDLISILVETNFISQTERLERRQRILQRFDPILSVQRILPLLFEVH